MIARIGAVVVLSFGLAACSSGGDGAGSASDAPMPTPSTSTAPPATGAPEQQGPQVVSRDVFEAKFVNAFTKANTPPTGKALIINSGTDPSSIEANGGVDTALEVWNADGSYSLDTISDRNGKQTVIRVLCPTVDECWRSEDGGTEWATDTDTPADLAVSVTDRAVALISDEESTFTIDQNTYIATAANGASVVYTFGDGNYQVTKVEDGIRTSTTGAITAAVPIEAPVVNTSYEEPTPAASKPAKKKTPKATTGN